MTETCRLRQVEGYEVCADEVRVERCGKSAPDGWRLSVAVNSIRSNTVVGSIWLARPLPRGGLSVLATGRLDR